MRVIVKYMRGKSPAILLDYPVIYEVYFRTEKILRRPLMKKTVITVVGHDTVGIIAKVCMYLAEHNINIEDISQTILQGIFNMMMIVDTSKSDVSAVQMSDALGAIGEELGVVIRCQHEDIFNMMHRL